MGVGAVGVEARIEVSVEPFPGLVLRDTGSAVRGCIGYIEGGGVS